MTRASSSNASWPTSSRTPSRSCAGATRACGPGTPISRKKLGRCREAGQGAASSAGRGHGPDPSARQRPRGPRGLPGGVGSPQGRPQAAARVAGLPHRAGADQARCPACVVPGRSPVGPSPSRPHPESSTTIVVPPAAAAVPVPPVAATPAARRLSDYSFDELLRRFEQEQTPERLGHVLSRAWYQQGLVTLPAGLLRAHPAVAAALDARGSGAGQAHPRRRPSAATGASASPRGGVGPAYRPERGRVMYCAYSTPGVQLQRLLGPHQAAWPTGCGSRAATSSSSDGPATRGTRRRTAKHPAPVRHVVSLEGVDYVHLPGAQARHHPDRPLHARVRRRLRPRGAADAPQRHPRRLQLPGRAGGAHRRPSPRASLRLRGARALGDHRGLGQAGLGRRPTATASRSSSRTSSRPRQTLVLAITAQTKRRAGPPGRGPGADHAGAQRCRPHEFLPLPKDAAYAARASGSARTCRSSVSPAAWCPTRGWALLLDAAAILRDAGVDFQVVLAGSGSAEPDLKDQVAELGLE